MSKKTLIILLTVILIVSGYFIYKAMRPKDTVKYKKEFPKIARIIEKVEAAGTINPVTQTSVGTQISGRLQELFVDFNSIVKKGQVLAVIDPSTYESTVLQQQANLQRLESILKNAKRNFERYQKLYKEALIARSELDNAEVDYLSALAQVTQAKATLDKAQIDLEYTKIVSPVDGIVISKEVELGQTVAASFQTPTLFLVAEDLTKMQIEVNISEADISKVNEGQDVEFSVDAYPDLTFKGTVSQVRNSPTTIQNVVTYTVVVEVDNHDMKLKPGMTANASIITARKKDILTVSNQSLRFVPPPSAKIKESAPAAGQENGAEKTEAKQEREARRSGSGAGSSAQQSQKLSFQGQGVWRQHPGGVLERIEIKTGITDGTRTEVTGGDLTKDIEIITAVQSGVQTQRNNQGGGMRVRF